jgi:hypothetical protein
MYTKTVIHQHELCRVGLALEVGIVGCYTGCGRTEQNRTEVGIVGCYSLLMAIEAPLVADILKAVLPMEP